MKKVLIITIHSAHNFGAVLQAFALQKYIENLGYQTEIIDYRPAYITDEYKLIILKKDNESILRTLAATILSFPYKIFKSNRFNMFINNNLKLTKQTFKNFTQIKESVPDADLYIVGSDQVWNSDITKGVDPTFYLGFVKGGRKISFASSFGKDFVLDKDKEAIRKYLKTFDAISTRENSGKEVLKDLGILDTTVVADPVFLNSNEEYKRMAIFPKEKKYLLIYFVERNPLLTLLARKIAGQHNLKIISIGGFLNSCKADHHIRTAGPKEFLGYLINADYVITNSFHGTAFSIVFNKNFAAVKLICNRGTRIESLLDNCGLHDRFVGSEQDFKKVMQPVPYGVVSEEISNMVQSSKEFINNSIK